VHHIVEDTEAVAAWAAEWIAEAVHGAVRHKGSCSLALSGGASPGETYRKLAALWAVPWPQVEVFFSDERAVPPDSSESNYRMAREALLSQVPIPSARIHRMEAERSDLNAVAREYEALLPASLDVLLLGIGADGHTASLFPHAPALAESQRLVLAVVGGDPLVQRLTITPPVIARASRLLVIATGANKAAAVARALEGPDDVAGLPAQLARHGTWILDQPAAASLRGAGGHEASSPADAPS
jgi:6-phosphogluconolactonase